MCKTFLDPIFMQFLQSFLDTPRNAVYFLIWPAACTAFHRLGKETPLNDRNVGTHRPGWSEIDYRSLAGGCHSPREGSRSTGGGCAFHRPAGHLAAFFDSAETARGRHLHGRLGVDRSSNRGFQAIQE